MSVVAPKVVFTNRCVSNVPEKTFSWVYLHGHLSTLVGYDVVTQPESNADYTEPGIYPVIVRDENMVDYHANLFFWFEPNGNNRGLICFTRDEVAMNYAMNKLNQRANIL